MAHSMVHERAIGKTIAAVYLGDAERVPSGDGGVFRGEYVAFEFTDGTALELLAAAGNSFAVGSGRELKRAKRAKRSRGTHQEKAT